MNNDVSELVQRLHQADMNVVYVCAGAGTAALGALFSVSGASRTVLECNVPYSHNSFDRFLGRKPQKYVSERSALQLAGRALTRAQLLADTEVVLIGLSCTAAIVTSKVKRGLHRAYIATWQQNCVVTYYLELEKGSRDRKREEDVVSRVVLNALAEAAGLEPCLGIAWLAGDKLERVVYDIDAAADKLYRRELDYFCVEDFGRISYQPTKPVYIISGSFNPLHIGHINLAHAASKYLGEPLAFELSAFNVDKPAIEKAVALARISQFAGYFSVYLTNAPTFLEKSRLFAEATFIVGFDTAERILMPRYYGDSEDNLFAALREIRSHGCNFLVAPRANKDNQLKTVHDMVIPVEFVELFDELPDFRQDISSTELRAVGAKGDR